MTTENEKWQGKPEEGAYNAGREGNDFRSSYGRERNFDRPRRNFREGGERSYGERSHGERRSYNGGERSFSGERRSYNNDRPRRSFNHEGGERSFGGERNYGERRSYNGGERSFGERKSFNNERAIGKERTFNRERSFGGERRSYNGGERSFGDRPFNRERSFNGERSFGGERSFNKDRSYGGDRRSFNDRPRRPRIGGKKENPEWLAENDFKAPKYAPNLDPTTPIRLNKFLSNAGICSRREADEYIQAGVVKVNGEIATELGVKVMPTDEVMFHDQPVRIERKVYVLLNKPKDCVTTSEDPQERLTVMDLVKNACYERIYPVGRLDRNTTGVLLLTNDGDLASKLAHPKYEKRKIYQATLDKDLPQEVMDEIAKGVDLDGEMIAIDEISYVNEKPNVIGLEIHSGQNRVVRRIFEKFGYKVYKLDRVYFAGLTKKNLPRGKWRHLTEREVGLLKMGVFA